jgi:hypothetical protein
MDERASNVRSAAMRYEDLDERLRLRGKHPEPGGRRSMGQHGTGARSSERRPQTQRGVVSDRSRDIDPPLKRNDTAGSHLDIEDVSRQPGTNDRFRVQELARRAGKGMEITGMGHRLPPFSGPATRSPEVLGTGVRHKADMSAQNFW